MTVAEQVSAKLQPYPAYRDSGVPWIGEVPVGWEVRRLGTLLTRRTETGRADLPLLSVYRDFGVVTREGRDDNHNRASEDLSNYRVVEPGDLAINKMKAWQGSLGISELEGIVSPAYVICKVAPSVQGRFLHHLLRSRLYIKEYARLSYGVRVDQWELRLGDLKNIKALLPPPDEQQAIASFLDRETTRIDELVREQEALLGDLGEKRRAVITKAVTEGLQHNQTTWDAGVPWLRRVPTTWKAEPLKSLVRFQGGHTPKDEPYLWDGDVPWVSPKDMKAHIIRQSEDTVSEAALHEGNLNLYPVGSVLMVVRSGILRHKIPVALNAVPVTVNQDMKVLRPSSRLDARFLQVFFEGLGPTLLPVLQKVGATVESINMAALRGLLVPVPLPEEQRTIATYLDERLAQIDTLVQEVRASIEDMRLHRSALITAAVTGKIDVRYLGHA